MGNRTISSWGQLIPLRPGSEPSSDESGERRAWVRYVSDLITLCEPTETGQSETFLAQVRNISRGGVNLVLDQQFAQSSVDEGGFQSPLAGAATSRSTSVPISSCARSRS